MVRKVSVVVPSSKSGQILNILLMHKSVHHLAYQSCLGENGTQNVSFQFKIVNKKTHEIIDLLTRFGVASSYGTLDITALTSTKPRISTVRQNTYFPSSSDSTKGASQSSAMSTTSSRKKKKKYAIHDKLAYDEIYDTIDGQIHLTFDYLALCSVGGIIAAVGLLTNSSVSVVASMLVSPLMGPIVGMTFGAIVKDRSMFWKSLRNEFVGILVCFLTGGLMGFITAPILDDPKDPNMIINANNTQMSSRGDWMSLAWGAGIAIPSGVGVALGVVSDQVSALIGVAISAALLPPIVNSGLALCSAMVFAINPKYGDNVVSQWVMTGVVSLMLFFLNWILIFIFGIITFRMKRLHYSAEDEIRMKKIGDFYARMKDNEIMLSPLQSKKKMSKSDQNSPNGRPFMTSMGALMPGQHHKKGAVTFDDVNTPLLMEPVIQYNNKQEQNKNIAVRPSNLKNVAAEIVINTGVTHLAATQSDNIVVQSRNIGNVNNTMPSTTRYRTTRGNSEITKPVTVLVNSNNKAHKPKRSSLDVNSLTSSFT